MVVGVLSWWWWILLGDLCAQTRCCLTLRRAGAGCGCRFREWTGGVVDYSLAGAESVRLSWGIVIVIALIHGRGRNMKYEAVKC